MSGGYILLHRSVFDADRFPNEPFSEREAWIWIICHANYKDGTIDFNGKKVAIKRGELPTSFRRLSDVFGWGVNRVRNFIKNTATDTRIDTRTDTGFLIITICNYDKYQPSLTNSDTLADTPSDTRTDTTRINNNNIYPPIVPPEAHGETPPVQATRFSLSEMPSEWRDFVAVNHPMLDPKKTFADFRDRKLGEYGRKAYSADWFAEFKIWCRKAEVYNRMEPNPPPKQRYTPMPSAAGG